ncbi:MAG: uncharacterized membrane protein YjgN (DUF898 family) [Candidatus Pseudothioglobus sp.]|jgi:uncharacterized membrane protein YjgN (DUF898 family)
MTQLASGGLVPSRTLTNDEEKSVTDVNVVDEDATERSAAIGAKARMLLEFRGDGAEYFKIWIVNVVLTILTLGVYSAWAKVRNKRYFYSNMFLDGHHFEYLANPITILKSRIVAVIALGIYLGASSFFPMVAIGLMVALLIAMPWLIVRSLAFNHRMTAYRNVQFRFHGKYRQAAMVLFVWPLVGVFTFGIMYPYALLKLNEYIVFESAFGTSRFRFDAKYGDYGWVFLKVMGFFVVGMFVSVFVTALFVPLTSPEAAPFISLAPIMAIYLLVFIYMTVAFTNVFYNATSIRGCEFEADLKLGGYAKVIFINVFLTIITLGLYLPAAKIRSTRYVVENMAFIADGPLDDFIAAEREQISALGEEFGEVFDFDIGIT